MKYIAFALVAAIWIVVGVMLSGCSSFGPATFSVESDKYGKFSYELPELPREWKVYHDK